MDSLRLKIEEEVLNIPTRKYRATNMSGITYTDRHAIKTITAVVASNPETEERIQQHLNAKSGNGFQIWTSPVAKNHGAWARALRNKIKCETQNGRLGSNGEKTVILIGGPLTLQEAQTIFRIGRKVRVVHVGMETNRSAMNARERGINVAIRYLRDNGCTITVMSPHTEISIVGREISRHLNDADVLQAPIVPKIRAAYGYGAPPKIVISGIDGKFRAKRMRAAQKNGKPTSEAEALAMAMSSK